jgi:hypothetical protein
VTAEHDVHPSPIDVLFSPAERWGWRFSPPRLAMLSPERNEPPPSQPGEELAVTWRRWRDRIQQHETLERLRVLSEPWWFSSRPQQPWSVTPVFGGSRIGWEALLATLGTSVLAGGHSLTIANLSEWQVTASLAELASARGISVSRATISAEESSLDLFEGLSSEELISLVLNALATEDPSAHRREHMEDRALLRSIAVRLKPHVNLGRLRSALRILLREAPLTEVDAQLSGDEFDGLTEMFGQEIRTGTDLLGRSYQLEHALQELSFFARLPVTTGGGTNAAMAPATGATGQVAQLLLYDVAHDMEIHEHDLGADLLVQRLLRQLTDKGSVSGADDVLVIAGADRLYQRTLDRLLALADTRRLRVVLMFTRLRDHALGALGASDTCIFMRLSDYREATHAAEQVGRNHKFVLSTTTQTRGHAYDQGTNRSSSREQGRSTSSTFGGQFSVSHSANVGESQSQGSSTSQNVSASESESYQRVYEFALEPREVQALPETALFLVEQARGTSAVADCDPTIALQPKLG